MNAESWVDRLAGRPAVLRAIALILCAGCALVYAAIGLGLIYEQHPDGMRLWVFGYSAASAFALGVVLLFARPGRIVWILGSTLMILVIVAYVLVAPSRQPSFEIWGISLKIAQLLILASLVGLLVHDRKVRVAGA